MAKQWFAMAVALGMSLGAAGVARAGDDPAKDEAGKKDSGKITYPASGTDDAAMPADATVPAEEMATDSPLDRENQSGMEGSAHSLKGEEAKQLQTKLQEKGFYQGKIDGNIGPKTIQALKEFQKEQGLQESGSLDGQTKTALGITGASDVQPVKGTDESKSESKPAEPSTHPATGGSTGADSAEGSAPDSAHGSGDVDMQAGGTAPTKMDGKMDGNMDHSKMSGNMDHSKMAGHMEHMKSAQEKLKAQGYFTGSADGADNEEFKTALRKFQRAKGIPESGTLDEKTAAALGISMGAGTEVKTQSGTDTDVKDDEAAPAPPTP